MRYVGLLIAVAACIAGSQSTRAQVYNQMDEDGNIVQMDESGNNGNFNPHRNDSTKHNKVVPKGLYVWSVDRKFGDIHEAEIDTMPHLFPQSTLGMGRLMDYQTIGSNFSARQSRIFIDRQEKSQFAFLDVYNQVLKSPERWHFTNTLSPITNLTYDNCGDKQDGEDHLDAKFAANVGKRLGAGFDLDYAYARGYYQRQSNSHFGASLYASYLGDRYQLHLLLSTYHEKATENGGISNDNYITHPELEQQTYSTSEIPVVLESNWNRNDHHHMFLTHRYSVGFYRKVKMTEAEIAARKFAEESAKQNKQKKDSLNAANPDAPDSAPADTLAAVPTDSLGNMLKREYVPVTSFIHTLDLGSFHRKYQAYETPKNFYDQMYFYAVPDGYTGTDSIYDETKHFDMKNTLAVALLEGFNKYVPAGLKVFATHETRRFDMPVYDGTLDLDDRTSWLERTTEYNISIGAQLQKTQGHTLHYNLTAETWMVGEDAGQLKLDGTADLNFPLLGDTVRLAAKAYIHRLNPTFYERHYHGKHFWWDNSDMDKEMRTRIEGVFTLEKTKTSLRLAIEEIQNYTYYGMSYTRNADVLNNYTAGIRQHGGNLNIMTAQLDQKLQAGPLHWDNVLTYQSTSNDEVLPLPTFNVFSNLYLNFMVAGVLRVELGAAATWFTKYNAPEFCPGLNQFAVQENADVRTEVGNFPFVDVYANLHLKHTRFFLLMQNVLGDSANRQYFLTPHHPQNKSVLHFGVSWNFFN